MAVSVHGRDDLVAVGDFTDAGGDLAADGAARWNGRTWQALGRGPGIGPNSDVQEALFLPNGDVVLAVYATSDTTLSGSSFITRWDS